MENRSRTQIAYVKGWGHLFPNLLGPEEVEIGLSYLIWAAEDEAEDADNETDDDDDGYDDDDDYGDVMTTTRTSTTTMLMMTTTVMRTAETPSQHAPRGHKVTKESQTSKRSK